MKSFPNSDTPPGRRLKKLGYKNVTNKVGDGFKGWPEHAPFDKIIVTCSPEKVPQPLIEQLKDGGKMLIPLGERYQQVFHMFEKKDGRLVKRRLVPTLFVPMTGISEKNRDVQPDPANPKAINGSFEVDANKDGRPDNWHYQRQLTFKTGTAPDGNRYIELNNTQGGRHAQLLQGLALDGRRVKKVSIRATVKFSRTAIGPANELPGILIHYFDANRKPVSRNGIGPFLGTLEEWTRYRKTFTVPASAREAVIQIGLNGGTGTLSIDDVSLTPVK